MSPRAPSSRRSRSKLRNSTSGSADRARRSESSPRCRRSPRPRTGPRSWAAGLDSRTGRQARRQSHAGSSDSRTSQKQYRSPVNPPQADAGHESNGQPQGVRNIWGGTRSWVGGSVFLQPRSAEWRARATFSEPGAFASASDFRNRIRSDRRDLFRPSLPLIPGMSAVNHNSPMGYCTPFREVMASESGVSGGRSRFARLRPQGTYPLCQGSCRLRRVAA